MQLRESVKSKNMKDTLGDKMEEFFQWAEHSCPVDPHKCTLNDEKAHRFVWCVTFREQKPRGGTKEKHISQQHFGIISYKATMAKCCARTLKSLSVRLGSNLARAR